jgi:hypothetical protein
MAAKMSGKSKNASQAMKTSDNDVNAPKTPHILRTGLDDGPPNSICQCDGSPVHCPVHPTEMSRISHALKSGHFHSHWSNERLVEACAPYLKDGETPAECIKRNRDDALSVMALLGNSKHANESLCEIWADSRARHIKAERIVQAIRSWVEENASFDPAVGHYLSQVKLIDFIELSLSDGR